MDGEPVSAQVTRMLQKAAEGRHSAGELLPLVYDQLRAAVQRRMAAERADHTLQATELVHEAFLKLVGDRELPWRNRGHLYVFAAEAMRRFLLDRARARGREKRGGGPADRRTRRSPSRPSALDSMDGPPKSM